MGAAAAAAVLEETFLEEEDRFEDELSCCQPVSVVAPEPEQRARLGLPAAVRAALQASRPFEYIKASACDSVASRSSEEARIPEAIVITGLTGDCHYWPGSQGLAEGVEAAAPHGEHEARLDADGSC